MVHLTEYINQSKAITEALKYKGPSDREFSFESFMFENGVDDNTVTEDMMNWYANQIWMNGSIYYVTHNAFYDEYCHPFAYIAEMLNSISIDKFINSLSFVLKSKVKIYKDDPEFNGEQYTAKTILIPKDKFLNNLEKFDDLCDKYLWTFTSIKQEVNGQSRYMSSKFYDKDKLITDDNGNLFVRIEPDKPEIKNDYVKKCKYTLYHILYKKRNHTEKHNTSNTIESILKTGLRPKGTKNKYRFINKKVYLICGDTKETLKKNFDRVAETLAAGGTGKFNDKDFAIIQVDASKYDIDYYEDTYYNQEGILFTYAYFPPRMLKEVKYNELFK